MALDTYAALKASVADYLNRDDLTTVIADFVKLAEAKFNRKVRVRDMLTRTEASSANEFVALPDDFLEHYTLKEETTRTGPGLIYVGPDEAKRLKASGISGNLRYYTVIGSTFELIPAPSSSVDLQLVYYAKIASLSDSNTANWLLTKSPDLYLYSSLLEAAPYLKNDERVPLWSAAQTAILEDMRLESERSLRPTTSLAVRRRSFG